MARTLESAATRFENLPDVVHDHLRQRIFAGAVKAGQPLRQEDVARQLGISRVPVREALKRLEAEGLVEFRPRRGYVVATLDPDEIAEIFEIRMILEKQAGGLAARHRTEDDAGPIEVLLRAMDGALTLEPDTIERFARLNREFHARLTACSGRPRLCRLMDLLRDQVEGYVRMDAATPGRLEEAQREHWAIFEAFRAGDRRTTAQLCAAHCEHTLNNVLGSLSRQGARGIPRHAGAR